MAVGNSLATSIHQAPEPQPTSTRRLELDKKDEYRYALAHEAAEKHSRQGRMMRLVVIDPTWWLLDRHSGVGTCFSRCHDIYVRSL